SCPDWHGSADRRPGQLLGDVRTARPRALPLPGPAVDPQTPRAAGIDRQPAPLFGSGRSGPRDYHERPRSAQGARGRPGEGAEEGRGLARQIAVLVRRVEGLALGIDGEGVGDVELLALDRPVRHALVALEDGEGCALDLDFARTSQAPAALGTGEGVNHETL